MSEPDSFMAGVLPGEPAQDAPVERNGEPARLFDCFASGPTGLYFTNPDGSLSGRDADSLAAIAERGVRPVVVLPPFCPFVGEAARGRVLDHSGVVHERYDARPGTFYLIDPARLVLGRWRSLSVEAVGARLSARAAGR